MTIEVLSERIENPLNRINASLEKITNNLERMSDTNDNLIKFNYSFGSFMKSIHLNADCIQFNHVSLFTKQTC